MSLFSQIQRFFQGDEPVSSPKEPEHPELLRIILLLEVASYDNEFAEEERIFIETLLTEKYGVQLERLAELFEMARQKRDTFPDIHSFTRQVNEQMPHRDKYELMVELWQVIFADHKVDEQEEHFARKMQKLLRLDHSEWIRAKLAAQK